MYEVGIPPPYNLVNPHGLVASLISTSLMLCCKSLVSGLIYSKFVKDVYGLMQRILYLIFIIPRCNVTVTLVEHCVITNVPLYVFHIFIHQDY